MEPWSSGSAGLMVPSGFGRNGRHGYLRGEAIEGEMADLEIVLRCTGCRDYTEFERIGDKVVRCVDCRKRHSTDSLHAVEPGEEPSFE